MRLYEQLEKTINRKKLLKQIAENFFVIQDDKRFKGCGHEHIIRGLTLFALKRLRSVGCSRISSANLNLQAEGKSHATVIHEKYGKYEVPVSGMSGLVGLVLGNFQENRTECLLKMIWVSHPFHQIRPILVD